MGPPCPPVSRLINSIQLAIVDLDERDIDRAIRLWQRERLVEAEEVPVEAARGSGIADEHRKMRNAEDARARDRRLNRQSQGHAGREDGFVRSP